MALRGCRSTAALISISLETRCCEGDFADKLYTQLSSGKYDVCSVLRMPDSLTAWRAEHRTARKRSDRCVRLGYDAAQVSRSEYADDIYAINTSLAERQGKPMSEGYRHQPASSPDPIWTCQRHGVHTYGVLDYKGHLRAYLWLYRSGELALVSQILGHGAHLQNDVMYLLWTYMLLHEIPHGGFVVYNRHDSGTDGLRYYKERVGLAPREVQWLR